MNKTLLSFSAVVGILLVVAGYFFFNKSKTSVSDTSSANTLTILWAAWKPADYLQKLTNDFTKETGIKVKIVQDPWGTFTDTFFNEMKKKEAGKFDMVVGDSQWLGRGSTEGDYVELTQ